MEKWEKIQEGKSDKQDKPDKPSKKMKGEDLNGQENLPQKKEKSAKIPPKKTSKKKQPILLKGQTKMTAFLRM